MLAGWGRGGFLGEAQHEQQLVVPPGRVVAQVADEQAGDLVPGPRAELAGIDGVEPAGHEGKQLSLDASLLA